MQVEDGVGSTMLVDVANLSLRELDALGESAIACTLREVLGRDDKDVEVFSNFQSRS
ncbi:FXSXX-COOH protein [Nocardiopsis sp. YSL2]|uniref:FXSXX-COOH protein n=1 Tax=Nocardiopsis sp. YSL2 TaxID=2939492 RepID=UPI0026F4376B|nr:FXSXX-COOH protein [Nocardiopsis sp. YSL2]